MGAIARTGAFDFIRPTRSREAFAKFLKHDFRDLDLKRSDRLVESGLYSLLIASFCHNEYSVPRNNRGSGISWWEWPTSPGEAQRQVLPQPRDTSLTREARFLEAALGDQRIVACGVGLTNTDLVAETYPKGMDQVLKQTLCFDRPRSLAGTPG